MTSTKMRRAPGWVATGQTRTGEGEGGRAAPPRLVRARARGSGETAKLYPATSSQQSSRSARMRAAATTRRGGRRAALPRAIAAGSPGNRPGGYGPVRGPGRPPTAGGREAGEGAGGQQDHGAQPAQGRGYLHRGRLSSRTVRESFTRRRREAPGAIPRPPAPRCGAAAAARAPSRPESGGKEQHAQGPASSSSQGREGSSRVFTCRVSG